MASIELAEVEATARLTDMVAATCQPVLSEAELGRLLEQAKMPDRFGAKPTDAVWTPTWELNQAAAQGWRLKAGKAASDVSFGADGATYNRKEAIENCRAMAKDYEARIVRGVSTVEHWDDLDDYLGNS